MHSKPIGPIMALLLYATFTIFSCKTNKTSLSSNTQNPAINNCDPSITYSGKLKPIVDKNCSISGCHDANFKQLDFTGYSKLKKLADAGEIYQHVIKIKNMPPNHKLTEDELKAFKCWLEGGAKE